MTMPDAPYAYSDVHEAAPSHHEALAALLDSRTQNRIINLPGWEFGKKRCADVGTGSGTVANWLATCVGRSGFVLATDTNLAALRQPHERLVMFVHDISLTKLPDAAYDLVLARCVLNHLPNRGDAVLNMIDSLAPGGWLVTEDFLPHRDSNFVLEAPSTAARALLRRFHAAHQAILSNRGNDRNWAPRAHDFMRKTGLKSVTVSEWGEPWPGGSPGARLMAAIAAQLRSELLEFGLAEAELDELDELLKDEQVVLNGHVVFSTAGQLPGESSAL